MRDYKGRRLESHAARPKVQETGTRFLGMGRGRRTPVPASYRGSAGKVLPAGSGIVPRPHEGFSCILVTLGDT